MNSLRLYKVIAGVCFAALISQLFFPDLYPWSRRTFTIPVEDLKADMRSHAVWSAEVSVLLRDTSAFWRDTLADDGIEYTAPQISTQFGKGENVCASGVGSQVPVYCISLKRVVVDTGDFQAMSRQLGRLNHLAVAYVFAHQIGHHVQNLRGTLERRPGEDRTAYLGRVELQADCYAGVWLHHAMDRYGKLTAADLQKIHTQIYGRFAEPLGPEVPDALMETFDYADARTRARSAQKGFASGEIADC